MKEEKKREIGILTKYNILLYIKWNENNLFDAPHLIHISVIDNI